ncbi:MAG: hypothetical protein HYU97_10830 [Deltaproteobacteria bacterium]|nr:hypothetical protein [Deltaproteobacteria bacterium]
MRRFVKVSLLIFFLTFSLGYLLVSFKGQAEDNRSQVQTHAMDIILKKYKKMGLSEGDLYRDLLSSNTLFFDSRKDLFLFSALKALKDRSASTEEKTGAKVTVKRQINEIYSEFDEGSLQKTAWLFAAEKNYKAMLFDDWLSKAGMTGLFSPDGLRKALDKQGAGGALKGNVSEGFPELPHPSMRDSMIGCLDDYKKSKEQAGLAGPGGGVRPGGGTINPGGKAGMSGEPGGGGKRDLSGKHGMGTVGSEGHGDIPGPKGCFGIDMGKMQDYAGKLPDLPKGGSWEVNIKVPTADGSKTVSTTTSFSVTSQGDGTVTGTSKTTITTSWNVGGQEISSSSAVGPPTTIPDGTNDQRYNNAIGGGEGVPGAVTTATTTDKNGGTVTGTTKNDAEGNEISPTTKYNPDADPSNPCGPDVAGFAACVMGTQGKTAKQEFQDMVSECVFYVYEECSSSGCEVKKTKTPPPEGGEAYQTVGGGGGEGGSGKPPSGEGSTKSGASLAFSTEGACAGFSPGCYNYLKNLYGSGSGIKDIDPTEGSPCGVDASEGLGIIEQTLVIDPANLKLGLSDLVKGTLGIGQASPSKGTGGKGLPKQP